MAHILELPDEILLSIMTLLSTSDVISLSSTCSRLSALLSDRSLWRNVDLRHSRLSADQLHRLWRHLHSDTARVAVRGHLNSGAPGGPPLLTSALLTEIRDKSPTLTELRLEGCVLDATKVTLTQLPSTLVVLSLSGCDVLHPYCSGRSYMAGLSDCCPRLERVDLSRSGWLRSHALLALSKLPRLRRLCLRACRRLGAEVAYSGIAGMLGFRRLRHLDLRQTLTNDADVTSFSQLPELAELLLEPLRGRRLDAKSIVRALAHGLGDRLQLLSLRGCQQLGACDLPGQLPRLRRLDVTRCDNVSGRDVRRLREQMSDCLVGWHRPPSITAPGRKRSLPCPDESEPPASSSSASHFQQDYPSPKRSRLESHSGAPAVSQEGQQLPDVTSPSRDVSAGPCVCLSCSPADGENGNDEDAARQLSPLPSPPPPWEVTSSLQGRPSPATADGAADPQPVVIVLNLFGDRNRRPEARLADAGEMMEILNAAGRPAALPQMEDRHRQIQAAIGAHGGGGGEAGGVQDGGGEAGGFQDGGGEAGVVQDGGGEAGVVQDGGGEADCVQGGGHLPRDIDSDDDGDIEPRAVLLD